MLISDGAYSFLRGYLADIRDLNNVQLACNMIFGKKNKDSLYSYLVELRRERKPMLLIKSWKARRAESLVYHAGRAGRAILSERRLI